MLIGGKVNPGTPLLMAKDHVTEATLHETTGLPVMMAFNAGNLAAVAKAYRAVGPSRPIINVDNSGHHLPRRPVPLSNVGHEKAEANAAAISGIAALPSFLRGVRGSE